VVAANQPSHQCQSGIDSRPNLPQIPSMAPRPVANSADLAGARAAVLVWLSLERETQVPSETTAEDLITEFLRRIEGSGFTFTLGEAGPPEETPRFELLWQHRGAEFVGFHQPPAAATPEEARLLGCAALLRNEWCRSQLDRTRLRGPSRESLSA